MEDEKIVQLYWDRDERAIPETAAKYGGYCTSIAQNILGSAEDAEECVNDTYMSAWNSIPPHRPGNLCTFLGKLTRNLSLNRYRYNTAHKRGTGEEPAGAPAQVTSEQVRALTPDMTREEVLALLGGTQDVGSGIYVYVYEVDGKYLLRIPFAGDGAQLGVTGEELLKSLTEK